MRALILPFPLTYRMKHRLAMKRRRDCRQYYRPSAEEKMADKVNFYIQKILKDERRTNEEKK